MLHRLKPTTLQQTVAFQASVCLANSIFPLNFAERAHYADVFDAVPRQWLRFDDVIVPTKGITVATFKPFAQ